MSFCNINFVKCESTSDKNQLEKQTKISKKKLFTNAIQFILLRIYKVFRCLFVHKGKKIVFGLQLSISEHSSICYCFTAPSGGKMTFVKFLNETQIIFPGFSVLLSKILLFMEYFKIITNIQRWNDVLERMLSRKCRLQWILVILCVAANVEEHQHLQCSLNGCSSAK